MLCRSKSGGAHIYLFIDERVSASLLQRKLRQLLGFHRFRTSRDIFLNKHSYLLERGDRGSTLNMPYFTEVKILQDTLVVKKVKL